MDADNIIPLVVAIFWGIAALVAKSAKKSKNTEGPKKGPGLMDRIQNTVENIAKEMQVEQSSDFKLEFLEDDIADEEIVIPKKAVQPVPVVEKGRRRVSSLKTSEYRRDSSKKSAEFSSKKLKDAIVWSEIIAPPLALRD